MLKEDRVVCQCNRCGFMMMVIKGDICPLFVKRGCFTFLKAISVHIYSISFIFYFLIFSFLKISRNEHVLW